ncbi:murein biosynthesis integral membrane protein MurJ [Afifella sp. IM 167]|uniref:murein biosynthesis integral membrane protein MurJ n=1 Tax=Afifella sp. IM 167 TaxID=2033586 RepID=UPI001CC95014|nr:murein biosynthesis integral membrane protein MurJ [Afifella sp. IM 167]MBZ8133589.1 murein biosynthesis integral membrane protein MurJ [Afifella sp. IM 167]
MSLVKKFLSVGGATLASRVLGFAREMMIAATLGAGPVADAFYAAFRFPNLFRRLFAEGAFNYAFVPLYSRRLEGDGEEAARRFAEDVLAVLLLTLLALTGLVMVATPFIVTVLAPGFREDPVKFALTIDLFRIMFPYLVLMSLTAMITGVLNAHRRFFIPALAPVLLNVTTIGALGATLWYGMEGEEVGRVLSWSVLAAGILQLAMVVLAARAIGFSIRLRRPRLTPGVKRLLWLAAPAAATGGITQINLFIGQIIASTKAGAISILQYADRLYQLPLGVVGIAIGVVLLPELSRTLKAEHFREATHVQNRALEFALFLTLPAAAALIAIPETLVSVLFERGAFAPETAEATARALRVFGFGLPAFVLVKVFNPGYFAREDTKTPMKFSAIAVAVNVTLALSLFPIFAEAGIAAAEAVAGWTNIVLLLTTLRRRGHWTVDGIVMKRGPRILAASLFLGAVLYAGAWWLAPFMQPGEPFLIRFGVLFGLCAAAGIVYFAFAHLIGASDRKNLAALLRRRPAGGSQ